ncbi:MAG: 4Fe-4S double cluster binding domain-containing protein [Thermoplasmata archaeon]
MASAEDADALRRVEIDEYGPVKSLRVREIMPDAHSVILFGIRASDDADELAIRRSRRRWDYPGYFPLKLIGRDLIAALRKMGYKAVMPQERIPRKAIAALTSIGAYGKNSMILSEKYGLSLRIEAVVTNARIKKDRPFKKDLCKDCDRCIRACPTKAIIKPYVLEPRRCFVRISEMGTDDEELMREFKRRSFWLTPNTYLMCTICQMACPYTSEERKRNRMR